MRTYDRTLAKVGDTIEIIEDAGEGLYGKEFTVKSIDEVVEEVGFDHYLDGVFYKADEKVAVKIYRIDTEESKDYPIWPYETTEVKGDIIEIEQYKHLGVVK